LSFLLRIAIWGGAGQAGGPAQKNAGWAGMLNPLFRNGPSRIDPQPAQAKGGVRQVDPLACL